MGAISGIWRQCGRALRKQVSFLLEPDLADQLREASATSGIPQGAIVSVALRVALARRPGKKMAELRRGPGGAVVVAMRLRKKGKTLAETAAALNRQGFRTAQGKPWSLVQVHRLLRQSG